VIAQQLRIPLEYNANEAHLQTPEMGQNRLNFNPVVTGRDACMTNTRGAPLRLTAA
jgi:hypothetical protein